MMDGGFVFDRHGFSFIPVQVQIVHELMHVMHNAQGLNLRNIPLKQDEDELWSSSEEYQTIKGGHINEAQFVEAYGARPRDRHRGINSAKLFNPNNRNPNETIDDLKKEYGISENSSEKFEKFKSTYKEIIHSEEQCEKNQSRLTLL
jgi:hypothetical protein